MEQAQLSKSNFRRSGAAAVECRW